MTYCYALALFKFFDVDLNSGPRINPLINNVMLDDVMFFKNHFIAAISSPLSFSKDK